MEIKNKYLKSLKFIPSPILFALIVALGLFLILAFYAFAHTDSFYLYDDLITLRANGTYKIDASADYDVSKLHWYTQNPEIATIDSDGTISAHALGETKIIVKSRFYLFEQEITIRVSNFNVYSIVFEEDDLELDPSDEFFLMPVLNGDGNLKSNLDWKSSDEGIVSVSSTGKIRALTPGNAIITATDKYSGLATSIKVKVHGEVEETEEVMADEATDEELDNTIPIESIELNTNRLEMYVGSTRKISSVIVPDNASNKTLTYTSSDSSIATVNSNGMVTAKKAGICNIFVSSADGLVSVSTIIKVSGKSVAVKSLSLKENNLKIKINENYTISPIITPSDASNKNISYSSSNPKVASVDSNGKVKGISPGKVTIVAITKDGMKTASIGVEVASDKIESNNIKKIDIDNFQDTLIVGDTNKLNVDVYNDKDDKLKVNLSSTNNDILSIDQDGNIVAKSPGMVSLEFETTDGSYHDNKIVTVLPGETDPELVYVNKNAMQLVKGETYTLIATILPEIASGKKIVWTSSNPSVVSVNTEGMVTALSMGTSTITAQVRNTGVSRSVKVAVVNNASLIDVRKMKLTPYIKGLQVYDKGSSTSRALQNFAIANIGTSKETLYVSYPHRSNIKKSLKATNTLKQQIVRTIVVKIPKSEYSKPKSSKRTYMYLKNSGHGQSFDLDKTNGYFWTNGSGYISKSSDGTLWGASKQLVRVKFKKNTKTSSYTAARRITLYNSAGAIYDSPELTFNWNENLAAVRSGRNVLIYKASDFVNGKLTLLYSFVLANKSIDGTNYSRQGHALANGYYYQYRGYYNKKMYIEAYNYVGELQYTYIFNPKLKGQETEGMKIYNNKIYVGIINKCSGCSGNINSIYYFK